MDCSPPSSFVHGILQARILEWVTMLPPGDHPNPGIEPRSSTLQVDSLLSEPQGKPKNTFRVDSLTLLQGNFPTQGSNTGLLHCRRILYQMSHKGNPWILEWVAYLFSRGYFQPRNQPGVSCIAGGFFITWATREALCLGQLTSKYEVKQ